MACVYDVGRLVIEPKRAAANRRNAAKSTGAKTAAGKQEVAKNAIKHGLLARRLILDGESPQEYQQLMDGLVESLHPVGLMEQMLVEKVAVAMWRQQRLVRAEAASIKAQQLRHSIEFQAQARRLVGNEDSDLGYGRIEGIGQSDQEDREWYGTLMAEVEKAQQQAGDQWAYIKKHCPELMDCVLVDYEDEGEDYIESNIVEILSENRKWATENLTRLKAKESRQMVLDLLAEVRGAPVGNELLQRYQVALDGELYRALTALQKQQEHRMKLHPTMEV